MGEEVKRIESVLKRFEDINNQNKQLFDQLLVVHKQVVEDMSRIREVLAELSLQEMIRQAESELYREKNNLTDIKLRNNELKKKILKRKTSVKNLRRDLVKIQKDTFRLKREVDSMLNSRSWRYTELARKIGDSLKGI